MKGKLSAMIRNICKSTSWISTQVNTEKVLFATSTPYICYKALPRDRLITLNAHNPLPFVLETLYHGLFSLVHPVDRLEKFH